MTNPRPLAPWYLPQYGVLTAQHIPDPDEVREGRPYALPFNFISIAPNATGQNFISPTIPLLIWGFTATAYNASGGAPSVTPAFQFRIAHRHGSFQRIVSTSMLANTNALGTAQFPNLLRKPYLFDTGETIGIELRSLDPADTLTIQIVAIGAQLPPLPPGVMPR